jgi:hypothetical protein
MHEWWLIKEAGSLWRVVGSDDPALWDCDWKYKAGLNRSFAERMAAEWNKGRDKSGNALKFR